MKSIQRLKKFVTGGQIRKYSTGGSYEEYIRQGYSPEDAKALVDLDLKNAKTQRGMNIATGVVGGLLDGASGGAASQSMEGISSALQQINSGEVNTINAKGEDISGKLKGTAIAAGAVSAGVQMVDNLAMGDKNFGAQSEAIDSAVHSASSALMSSGNPYAMIAGAALEGANFLTKAGGQTVQGFDVDINSSGYGQMGHMESSSSRDFGAMIGLGGIFGQGRMKEKLAKRNAQAKMAMNAANIADEQSFEQEARANSIQNTIMNNNIALAGGLNTSLLGG